MGNFRQDNRECDSVKIAGLYPLEKGGARCGQWGLGKVIDKILASIKTRVPVGGAATSLVEEGEGIVFGCFSDDFGIYAL